MMSSLPERNLEYEAQMDAVFHALADRTRRALIRRLAEGPAIIGELAEPFDMTLAAVSKHLRVLESANLIMREVDGRFHRCSLSAGPMKDADAWLRNYASFWEGSLDSLADYAAKHQGQSHEQ